MVNGVQGLIVEDCQCTGSEGANEEGSDKAGCIGDGNSVNVVPGAVGVLKGLIDDGVDHFDVTTRRYLWYNATILRMNVDLRVNDITE